MKFNTRTTTALIAFASLALASASSSDEALRATMRSVLDQLTAILPLAVGHEPLTDTERRDFEQRLVKLRASAVQITAHGRERDPGFRFLATSLNDDLRAVQVNWERHNEDSARYFLVGATANCVACHARLPQGTTPKIASSLEEQITNENTSANEKAQLLVATRQFDRALGVWESIFADPEMTPVELDIGGYFLDYLTISVRVMRDLRRPIPHLRSLAERPSTPRYLRAHLERWIADLEELAARPAPPDRLAAARALIRDREHGSGSERLVADLQASAWLLQTIESDNRTNPELAEAFHLLGVVEGRTVEGYWVAQTDAHLEAAVRLDPGGPYAGPSYDLLEEYLITGYAGFEDNELPRELELRLGSLIELMDAAASKATDRE